MKILFSTGSLYYLPIKDVFSLVREAGFDGCELVLDTKFGSNNYLHTVEECLKILPVHTIHAPFMKIEAWGNPMQALIRSVEIAKALNAHVVNFHPPSWFSLEIEFFRWFRRVKDFQEELKCNGVCLTIENMPLVYKRLMLAPYFLNDFDDLIDYGIKRNLYFTFDVTHIATFHKDIIAIFLRYFQTTKLKNVHLSDYADFKEHLFLGRGDLPIVKLLNAMRRLGYDEMVTLELSPYEWPRTQEWLFKSMQYELSFLKLHLGKI